VCDFSLECLARTGFRVDRSCCSGIGSAQHRPDLSLVVCSCCSVMRRPELRHGKSPIRPDLSLVVCSCCSVMRRPELRHGKSLPFACFPWSPQGAQFSGLLRFFLPPAADFFADLSPLAKARRRFAFSRRVEGASARSPVLPSFWFLPVHRPEAPRLHFQLGSSLLFPGFLTACC
jgi:hypothetical protein